LGRAYGDSIAKDSREKGGEKTYEKLWVRRFKNGEGSAKPEEANTFCSFSEEEEAPARVLRPQERHQQTIYIHDLKRV